MKKSSFTIEHLLFLLIVIAALALRLAYLGQAPLSGFEAGWALQALGVARGEAVVVGPQPAYVGLTSALFALTGSTTFLARFWPALAGGLLAGLPYFFRDKLGHKAALLFALGLAIDPGLVTLSRVAGGPMLAASFVLFGAVAWALGAANAAGILFALGLLSGPAAIHGLVGMGFALLLAKSVERQPLRIASAPLGQAAISGLITLLLAGTFFLRLPQGLGALANTFPAYFAGWVTPSGVQAAHLGLELLASQPLALALGLMAAIRTFSERGPLPRAMALWAVVALALAAVYPGRQVGDLVWALIPLWALAASELSRHLFIEEEDTIVPVGQAALILVLLSFAWLNLASLNTGALDEQSYFARLWFTGFVLGLVILFTALIGFGWSASQARRGLIWGVGAFLAFFTLSATSNAYQPTRAVNALWTPVPAAGEEALLLDTIGDLSEMVNGTRTEVDVVFQVDDPALRWALRNLPNARYAPQLASGEMPSLIITVKQSEEPAFSSFYRGQSMGWQYIPQWGTPFPPDIIGWFFFRDAPTAKSEIILWARADVFPAGSLVPGAEGGGSGEGEIVP